MNKRIVVGFLAVGLVGFPAASASAEAPPSPDLTGTWEGEYECSALFEGLPATETVPTTMEVSHVSDTEVRMRILPNFFYNGFAVGQVGKLTKGAVTFVECRTSPDSPVFNEVFSARFDTQKELRGRSAFNREFVTVGGMCVLDFVRTDTADPGIPACPTQ